MAANRAALQSFLTTNARNPELVLPATRLLEPFFRIAETGKYELAETDKELAKGAAAAIALAIGTTVSKVIFVSATRSQTKPEWLSEDDHRITLWNSIEDSLRTSLPNGLRDNFREHFSTVLSVSDRNGLRDIFNFSLFGGVSASLWHSSYRTDLKDCLSYGVWTSIFFLLGFVAAGDEEKVRQLAPLIKLLPRAIPIGEKWNEPGAWLVCVA